MKHAFSLVELSIVLVILGLLVGGILAGQSLIRASELRAVGTEYSRYQTAVHAFRDKYFALPGDMANAESFWGTLDPTCITVSATGMPTCNGDADGYIETSSTRSFEHLRAWQHLANAGLIEGTYTGNRSIVGSPWSVALGSNIPASKISGAGWAWITYPDYVADTPGWFVAAMFRPVNATNWLIYGTLNSTNSLTRGSVLKAEEAWNLDTKLDDGLPGTGRVTSFLSTYVSGCTTTAVASTSAYSLNSTGVSCTMLFGM